MSETKGTKSKLRSWAVALFVAAAIFIVWVLALMRLHEHFNGESFLHWKGAMDSLLALLAPVVIWLRLRQVRDANKARSA
jgi:hypothetical protein